MSDSTPGGGTADNPSPLDRWIARWQAAIDAATATGRIDTTAWGGRVVIGPPATAEELLGVETTIGVPIPGGLRRLLSLARSAEAIWHFQQGVEPPEPFDDIFAGECSLDLGTLVGQHEGYRSWIEKVFPDPGDPYDLVWHDKFPFLDVRNGDLIAIDTDGRVVYLSHDDGEGHGYAMGRDVEDFLDRWTVLGCPGPEDWQWLPFVSGPESLLDPDGKTARAWRRWFGIP